MIKGIEKRILGDVNTMRNKVFQARKDVRWRVHLVETVVMVTIRVFITVEASDFADQRHEKTVRFRQKLAIAAEMRMEIGTTSLLAKRARPNAHSLGGDLRQPEMSGRCSSRGQSIVPLTHRRHGVRQAETQLLEKFQA